MKLRVKILGFLAGRPVCMIHEKKAKEMSLHVNNRVLIKKGTNFLISVVDTISGNLFNSDEIGLSDEIVSQLNLKKQDFVEVSLVQPPNSINMIKHKLNGGILTKKEINEIVRDIANNALTEIEIAFFVSAVYSKGLSLREIKDLTNAMVASGNKLKLKGEVVDKHCIGGIAGNRTTPIIISICASTGLIMPKTSSRAITSAAGTSDSIETIAKVDFSLKEIKDIIRKTNACLVWGGALGLAPVDDKIIKVEKIANIDSISQMLASILSKKISVGSKYVLIDIPYGPSAKVNLNQAKRLREKFLKLSKFFNLKIDVVLTEGSEPIGNGVGPALEILDVKRVLGRNPNAPKDLERKSVLLAGKILEMSKRAKRGKGIEMAQKILDSGIAFEKFKQIIEAQGGSLRTLPLGRYEHKIFSERKGRIRHQDNRLLNDFARIAGCPEDKFAGIYLHKKAKDFVKKRELLMTVYAQSDEKLKNAINFYNKNKRKMMVFE